MSLGAYKARQVGGSTTEGGTRAPLTNSVKIHGEKSEFGGEKSWREVRDLWREVMEKSQRPMEKSHGEKSEIHGEKSVQPDTTNRALPEPGTV
jgi:hypothetical protein